MKHFFLIHGMRYFSRPFNRESLCSNLLFSYVRTQTFWRRRISPCHFLLLFNFIRELSLDWALAARWRMLFFNILQIIFHHLIPCFKTKVWGCLNLLTTSPLGLKLVWIYSFLMLSFSLRTDVLLLKVSWCKRFVSKWRYSNLRHSLYLIRIKCIRTHIKVWKVFNRFCVVIGRDWGRALNVEASCSLSSLV